MKSILLLMLATIFFGCSMNEEAKLDLSKWKKNTSDDVSRFRDSAVNPLTHSRMLIGLSRPEVMSILGDPDTSFSTVEIHDGVRKETENVRYLINYIPGKKSGYKRRTLDVILQNGRVKSTKVVDQRIF